MEDENEVITEEDIPEENAPDASHEDESSAEVEALKRKVICLENGILPEYTDDLSAIAANLMEKNGTDFAAAVKAAADKYPVFRGRKSEVVIKTGRRFANGGAPQDIGDIIREEQAKRKR